VSYFIGKLTILKNFFHKILTGTKVFVSLFISKYFFVRQRAFYHPKLY